MGVYHFSNAAPGTFHCLVAVQPFKLPGNHGGQAAFDSDSGTVLPLEGLPEEPGKGDNGRAFSISVVRVEDPVREHDIQHVPTIARQQSPAAENASQTTQLQPRGVFPFRERSSWISLAGLMWVTSRI